jgi:hypothetical protein
VRAIVRRLTRLENRFVPREDEESQRLRERLRRARMRLESMGHPNHELAASPNYDGPPLSLGERILRARRNYLCMEEAHDENCCRYQQISWRFYFPA